MFRYAALAVFSLVASHAWAQHATPAETPAAVSSSASAPKAVISMEEPLPGDHWTYEVRDDISGTVTSNRINVVTEVTPKDISVRYQKVGTNDQGFNVYDRSWNLTDSPPWRFSPNDGSGIRAPLAVGKTWPVQTNNVNSANGNVWKRSGISKVVGQESLTTKAGTFDTFKIETTFSARNTNNPTFKSEVTLQTWYAPAIDHWVKRTTASRTNGHLRDSSTIELVDYGRKP
jgi:hypothetical protein